MEDSLLSEEDSTPGRLSFPQRLQFSGKRDSLCLSEKNSFIGKREALNFSGIDMNSDTNISLNLSALNRTPVHSIIDGIEPSIQNGNDASILKDLGSTVNFNNISLSEINDSSSIMNTSTIQQQPTMNQENPDEMSYESLLRWEQAQGGVLDEKWKSIQKEVLEVGILMIAYV